MVESMTLSIFLLLERQKMLVCGWNWRMMELELLKLKLMHNLDPSFACPLQVDTARRSPQPGYKVQGT